MEIDNDTVPFALKMLLPIIVTAKDKLEKVYNLEHFVSRDNPLTCLPINKKISKILLGMINFVTQSTQKKFTQNQSNIEPQR